MIEAIVKFPPSGCLHCGIEQRQHGRQWTFSPTNWHSYELPRPAQIKARMLERRAAKLAGRA